MTPEDTALVLAQCASYDRRTVGRADVTAWYDALSDVDIDAARRAVVAHYRAETTWMMPAHVRRLVEAEKREGERQHYAQRARQLRLEVDAELERGPVRDRSEDVTALLERLRDILPDTTSDVFRRAEWLQRATRPDRDYGPPNPHYQGPPPPGGFPVPGDAS